MNLKELRLSKKLTQAEVSSILGLSLRSYKEYENNPLKMNTLKYKYLFTELERIGFIDEEHGILSLDYIKEKVSNVFEKYHVDYCYLFGSYASGLASEKSDVDLLVSTNVTGMEFFGLAETLREELHKKVDLLNLEQLNNNPELINEVLHKGIKIYG